MMRHAFVLTLALTSFGAFAQKDLSSNQRFRIIDVAQQQLRIVNTYKYKDSLSRSRAFTDSLYQPIKVSWSGYIGEEADFVQWMERQDVASVQCIRTAKPANKWRQTIPLLRTLGSPRPSCKPASEQ